MDQEQNTTGGMPMNGGSPKKSGAMLVIGAVVIFVVIAWVVLMQGKNSEQTGTGTTQTPNVMMNGSAMVPPTPVSSDAATAALSAQGTSDEVPAIESDLNATDLNSLNNVNQI